MPNILLTGFEPFGHTPINPAEGVARTLDGEKIGDWTVVGRVVPNTFFHSIRAVQEAIEELAPDVVVMLGEYGGRAMITVERIAFNRIDATRYRLVDNDGVAPQDQPTAPDGPAAYYTNASNPRDGESDARRGHPDRYLGHTGEHSSATT